MRKPIASLEPRCDVPGVFDKRIDEQRAPAEFGGLRRVGEGLDGACEKSAERGEGGLSVLVLSQVVVGLQPLHPYTGLNGVLAYGVVGMIVEGEEVARNAVVRTDIRTRRR